jgi:hypothetical protein
MKTRIRKLTKKFLVALIPGAFALGLMGCELVRAPDSGTWKGTAVFRDELYQPITCDMTLDLIHTDDSLRIYNIQNDCQRGSNRWSALSFDIHGSELWQGGRVVGHASSDGSVSFELPDAYYNSNFPVPASRVVVAWTKVGSALEFTQETYFANTVQRTHAWLNQQSGSSFTWDGSVDLHN